MKTPIISIVIPCYNQSLYMRETLNCVMEQTLSEWECIIVNDGSTDDTLSIAKEYTKKDKRFYVVDKPNGGLADARNAGIKASHGRYILPLDADDLIDPTYTEKGVKYLEDHPEVKLVYCKAKYFGDRNDEWILPNYDYNSIIYYNLIFCSCIYRRSDYDKTIGYNKNMKYGWEDWDFLLSLLSKDSKVYKIPEILFFYRKHGKSMISTANSHSEEMYKQIVANHLDIYHPLLYKVLTSENEKRKLKNMYDIISNSKSYRLGHALLRPFVFIKSHFKL